MHSDIQTNYTKRQEEKPTPSERESTIDSSNPVIDLVISKKYVYFSATLLLQNSNFRIQSLNYLFDYEQFVANKNGLRLQIWQIYI